MRRYQIPPHKSGEDLATVTRLDTPYEGVPPTPNEIAWASIRPTPRPLPENVRTMGDHERAKRKKFELGSKLAKLAYQELEADFRAKQQLDSKTDNVVYMSDYRRDRQG